MSEHSKSCDHEWHRHEDLPLTDKACSKCGTIGTACPDCGGVCLEGCGCDDDGMVVVPLPHADEVEAVRCESLPGLEFIPDSISRNGEGVTGFDCGSIQIDLTNSEASGWQWKIGGEWRPIE